MKVAWNDSSIDKAEHNADKSSKHHCNNDKCNNAEEQQRNIRAKI